MTSNPGEETPIALGLMLCDQVIVDKHSSKPSPIGIFTGLAVQNFEGPQRFSAFTALTNGRGEAKIELVSFRLDNGDQIYRQAYKISFPDPLVVINVTFRVRNVYFPAAGWYDFVLRVNGEHVAQRRVRVYLAPPNS